MEKTTSYLKSLFSSNSANSSKRLIGFISSISLIVAMFLYHTDTLVQSVAALAGACVTASAFENIFKK
jgi:ABC-type enterobactin transport system permease subunit